MYTDIMMGKRVSLNEMHSLLEAYDKLPKQSERGALAKLGVLQAALCTVMTAGDRDRTEHPCQVD